MHFPREIGYLYASVNSVLYTNEEGKAVTGSFVFRKRGENIEVMVVKEIESPEYATNFKPILQRMQDFSKVLTSVTMETNIKVTYEYEEQEISATIILKGWKSSLNNRERFALTKVQFWF